MADEKRKDEYDIELGEKNGKSFSPARPAEPIRYTPAPSSSLQNNPVRCTPKKFTLSRFQPFLTTVHAKDPSSDFLLRQFDIDDRHKQIRFIRYEDNEQQPGGSASANIRKGTDYNLNFFLLCVQSIVCVVAIQTCKSAGVITYRDFKTDEAKKWFPISVLLIGMIYTSTKALRYLSIPVYTIFKNLTIILIAYGEVLWFGGSVTPMALFSFGLMVLSSVIAAWADIKHALESHGQMSAEATAQIATLNAGYIWMLTNCLCTAAYVLGMRKRIKLTNFKDFDTMFYNNLLTIPILFVASIAVEDWSSANVLKNFPIDTRNTIIAAMIFSGLSSVFISYTSAWCVRVTSSTTYSMVGALNKLPIAVSGLIFFDAPVTIPSVSAIFVGFVSGIVYAVAKVRQNSKPKTGVLPTAAPVPVTMSASSQSMRDSFKS